MVDRVCDDLIIVATINPPPIHRSNTATTHSILHYNSVKVNKLTELDRLKLMPIGSSEADGISIKVCQSFNFTAKWLSIIPLYSQTFRIANW